MGIQPPQIGCGKDITTNTTMTVIEMKKKRAYKRKHCGGDTTNTSTVMKKRNTNTATVIEKKRNTNTSAVVEKKRNTNTSAVVEKKRKEKIVAIQIHQQLLRRKEKIVVVQILQL
ncbi:hypothetical protein MKX01_031100 [Papaver californicum]|nr:hypothetical protein MKX01_031100 [Papaver californicum]